MRVRAFTAAISLLTAGLLTGCGPDAGDLPLPGTTVPGKSFLVNAEFDDALNLAIGAKVKVNGIDVGRVKEVKADGFHAIAVLRVQEDANIHKGSTARLRYNTPLGELFVDIQSPKTGPVLTDGAIMKPPLTSTAPTVEDALASASMLINGGGLEQLKVITEEFQKAVGTRGPTLRRLLDRSSTFLAQANSTTEDIDRLLNALNGASQVLNRRQDIINRAVHEITPAAKVLRENTDEVVALLKEVVKLGKSANTLVSATRADLLTTIRELGPVLDAFYSLRGRFNHGLNLLAQAGALAQRTIQGDWVGTAVIGDLTESGLAVASGSKSGKTGDGGTSPGITLPLLPGVTLPPLPGITLPPLLPGLLGRASTDAGAKAGVQR